MSLEEQVACLTCSCYGEIFVTTVWVDQCISAVMAV